MSYIIAIIIIAIAGVAFTFTQSKPETITTTDGTPVVTENEAARSEELAEFDTETVIPASEEAVNENTEDTSSVYGNGSYTARATYFTPKRTEHEIAVTLTLTDDIVTDATILYDGAAPATGSHLGFDNAYKAAVIGQPVATLSLSRVGGASLTSTSFNEALESIKSEAQS